MHKEYILSSIFATMSWSPFACGVNLSNSHDEAAYPTECAIFPSMSSSYTWQNYSEWANDGSYKDDYTMKKTPRRRVAVKGYSEKEWESYFKNMEEAAESPLKRMATESEFIRAHAGRIAVSL